jgi:hypothetical protein
VEFSEVLSFNISRVDFYLDFLEASGIVPRITDSSTGSSLLAVYYWDCVKLLAYNLLLKHSND